MRSEWQNDDDSPSDRKMQYGPTYAPNAIQETHVIIPPGCNPDSLIVYSSIEGQD